MLAFSICILLYSEETHTYGTGVLWERPPPLLFSLYGLSAKSDALATQETRWISLCLVSHLRSLQKFAGGHDAVLAVDAAPVEVGVRDHIERVQSQTTAH